jgi:hypothetical protein
MPQRSPPHSARPVCATSVLTKFLRQAAIGALVATAACNATSQYDYNHLPAGYHWRAVYDRTTNAIVFYGQDPLTLETVYVGPDGHFFIYRHSGTIGQKDLTMHWDPHDAR